MADEKETIIIDLKVTESGTAVPKATDEVKALSTSILGLQQSSKKLRDERKLLDTSTTEGSNRIKEINKQIDLNDKAIKANSSSLEKQRLNIGNYTGALDKLIPGLGSTINGIIGMTKASLAFIATPIGLILAALALALAAVAAYFKGSEEGADKFAKVAAQASAVLNVLVDRVIKLGGAIVSFLSGDFQGGLKKMEESFSGIGDEIEREIGLAGDLADATDALADAELKYRIKAAETANQIKELILQSKNRSKTEQERISLTQKAIDLESDLSKDRNALDQENLRIVTEGIHLRNNQYEASKKANESEIEFAKRLVSSGQLLEKDRTAIVEAIEKYNSAQGESIGILEKVQNQQDALNDKLQATIDKQDQIIAKFRESAQAFVDAEDAKIAKILETEEAQLRAEADAEIAADKQAKQDKEDFDFRRKLKQDELNDTTKFDAEQIKNKQKTAQIKRVVDENSYSFTASLLNAAAGLFKQNTLAYKVLASATALINAGVAISRAYADYEYPASLFVSILAGAGALAAVAKINDVQFAEGGEYAPSKYVRVGGQLHSNGGTRYVGEDGNSFEAEKDEGIYILKRSAESDKINRLSALNMSHGGRSFGQSTWYAAQGGQIETRNVSASTSSAETERIVRTTMQNMPPIIVTVEDINAKNQQVNQITQKARVVG